jgi:hypothetical protein
MDTCVCFRSCLFRFRADTDEVVSQTDVDMQGPPSSTSSSGSHDLGISTSSPDTGLGIVQELKRRLDETRR